MSKRDSKKVIEAYRLARERYARLGVNTETALKRLARIPLSLPCWQGDDVGGFEKAGTCSDGGIQATGNYPGRARTGDELRADFEKALQLLPGKHRLNIHAMYAELGGKKVERNELGPEHYSSWMDWALDRRIGLDFNGTFFAHPKAASGLTLANRNVAIRQFWIEHAIACRRIGAAMGRKQGTPCVVNLWIPDGYKDNPADRKTPRELLKRSLDEIFAGKISEKYLIDAVESKLFGIGSESYVAGSHDFYVSYAVANRKMLCLDMGHFHPRESIADKISALLTFLDRLLLHVSRGVHWDSDHVAILTDELKEVAAEIVRGNYTDRVYFALDFFDASINRIAAWVIGARATLKALLMAHLEPARKLRGLEAAGDFTSRMALLEELKTCPAGAVWDYYCMQQDVPADDVFMKEIKDYEKRVLALRG